MNACTGAFGAGTRSRTRDAADLLFDRLGGLPVVRFAATRRRASRAAMRATCTCGLGAAIAGLTVFLIGSIGWLTPAGIAVALAVVFAAACALRRTSPLTRKFLASAVSCVGGLRERTDGVVYVAMLAVATRAVIPEGTGYSDAIYYHLAYAQDWANAGRLVVDPFMAFIFYANNFLLFFTAWIVVQAGAFVQFLTWSFGLARGAWAVRCGRRLCRLRAHARLGRRDRPPRRRCARFYADLPRLFRVGLHRRADRRDGLARGRRSCRSASASRGRIGCSLRRCWPVFWSA